MSLGLMSAFLKKKERDRPRPGKQGKTGGQIDRQIETLLKCQRPSSQGKKKTEGNIGKHGKTGENRGKHRKTEKNTGKQGNSGEKREKGNFKKYYVFGTYYGVFKKNTDISVI